MFSMLELHQFGLANYFRGKNNMIYGYGISYMFAGEDKIFFHVSSKRSSPMSDSEKFLNVLNNVLKEMKDLLLYNMDEKGRRKKAL